MKICANQEWKLWASSFICLKRETEGSSEPTQREHGIFTNGLKCTDKEPKMKWKWKQHPGRFKESPSVTQSEIASKVSVSLNTQGQR